MYLYVSGILSFKLFERKIKKSFLVISLLLTKFFNEIFLIESIFIVFHSTQFILISSANASSELASIDVSKINEIIHFLKIINVVFIN
jgi:hypothetical protein